jgi:hypothetical protein
MKHLVAYGRIAIFALLLSSGFAGHVGAAPAAVPELTLQSGDQKIIVQAFGVDEAV